MSKDTPEIDLSDNEYVTVEQVDGADELSFKCAIEDLDTLNLIKEAVKKEVTTSSKRMFKFEKGEKIIADKKMTRIAEELNDNISFIYGLDENVTIEKIRETLQSIVGLDIDLSEKYLAEIKSEMEETAKEEKQEKIAKAQKQKKANKAKAIKVAKAQKSSNNILKSMGNHNNQTANTVRRSGITRKEG